MGCILGVERSEREGAAQPIGLGNHSPSPAPSSRYWIPCGGTSRGGVPLDRGDRPFVLPPRLKGEAPAAQDGAQRGVGLGRFRHLGARTHPALLARTNPPVGVRIHDRAVVWRACAQHCGYSHIAHESARCRPSEPCHPLPAAARVPAPVVSVNRPLIRMSVPLGLGRETAFDIAGREHDGQPVLVSNSVAAFTVNGQVVVHGGLCVQKVEPSLPEADEALKPRRGGMRGHDMTRRITSSRCWVLVFQAKLAFSPGAGKFGTTHSPAARQKLLACRHDRARRQTGHRHRPQWYARHRRAAPNSSG